MSFAAAASPLTAGKRNNPPFWQGALFWSPAPPPATMLVGEPTSNGSTKMYPGILLLHGHHFPLGVDLDNNPPLLIFLRKKRWRKEALWMDCLTGQRSFSLCRILHQNAASPKRQRQGGCITAATNLSCSVHRQKPMVQAGPSSMACKFIAFAQTLAFTFQRCHLLSHARCRSPLQALRMG